MLLIIPMDVSEISVFFLTHASSVRCTSLYCQFNKYNLLGLQRNIEIVKNIMTEVKEVKVWGCTMMYRNAEMDETPRQ